MRVYKVKKNSSLLANCNVCFNNSLVLNGIKLVDGKKGTFLSMPSNEYKGDYYDTAYIMDKDDYNDLYEAIVEAYEKADD